MTMPIARDCPMWLRLLHFISGYFNRTNVFVRNTMFILTPPLVICTRPHVVARFDDFTFDSFGDLRM